METSREVMGFLKSQELENWLMKHPEVLPAAKHHAAKLEVNKLSQAWEKKPLKNKLMPWRSNETWKSHLDEMIALGKAKNLEAHTSLESQKANFLANEARWKGQLRGGKSKKYKKTRKSLRLCKRHQTKRR